jgi:hypothetical protein
MNLRWLVGNFADPEFALTPKQQREVTRLAHRKHVSQWGMALWTVVMIMGSWLLVGTTHAFVASLLEPLNIPSPRTAGFVVMALVAIVLTAWGYRWLYARPVRLAMRELGHDICVDCGYRLHGLGPDIRACPECGSARTALEEPRT